MKDTFNADSAWAFATVLTAGTLLAGCAAPDNSLGDSAVQAGFAGALGKRPPISSTYSYGGIGILIFTNCNIGPFLIDDVFAGSPAAKAGIKKGSTVTGVMNQPTDQMTVTDFVRSVRGEPGTDIVLEIETPEDRIRRKVALRRMNLTFTDNGQGQVLYPPSTTTTYTVHRGDTLDSIAKASGVSIGKLLAANKGLDSGRLHVGQVLQLPTNDLTNQEALETAAKRSEESRKKAAELVDRGLAPKEVFKLHPFEGVSAADSNSLMLTWKNRHLEKLLREATAQDLRSWIDDLEQTILAAADAAEKEKDLAQVLVVSGRGGEQGHLDEARAYRLRIEVLKPILAAIREEISNRTK